jgi:DNA mismatch repair protein MutS
MSQLTPLMQQYWQIKNSHPDKIILFRMGDFFEMFHQDAITAAPILGIALTSRNKKAQDETPLCGVPYHSVASIINKLLAKGLKVAIVEQVEDPKSTKNLVKRAVTRILTPGMVYDSSLLEGNSGHYMACWLDNTLALIEPTTGESIYYQGVSQKDLSQFLALWPVAELLAEDRILQEFAGFPEKFQKNLVLTSLNEMAFEQEKNLTTSLPKACLSLLSYLQSLNPSDTSFQRNLESSSDLLKALRPFSERTLSESLILSDATLKHLEIFQTANGSEDSLFACVDKTRTSGGARLLRNRLTSPSKKLQQIQKWHEDLDFWRARPESLKRIREVLSGVGDLERRLNRLTQSQCNARDLKSFADSLMNSLEALGIASEMQNSSDLSFDSADLDFIQIAQRMQQALVEDPPLLVRQGGMFVRGLSSNLDELIDLVENAQGILNKIEEREKESTGISNLRIKYNGVFGYSFEISTGQVAKVPAHYIRRQTLANAERFVTEELVELEKKILSAESRRSNLEYEMFCEFKNKLISHSQKYLQVAVRVSELDVTTANAWLSLEKNWVRPEFIPEGESGLYLKNSRHPVVEESLRKSNSPFIANSLELRQGQVLLLTGPNMAGKSTIMRQVALSVLLAQAGLFVPAEIAKMQIFDRIFTRIGASDMLARGHSTFMVEMSETAEMISFATSKSLLILDEVGRGTSTYDGVSLAQAILEFIIHKIGALTIFATHYHELADMAGNFREIRNMHMSVSEKDGEVRFLHTLREGPAQKSYGIYVAKIAGLPESIVSRAQILLKRLENQHQSRPKNESKAEAEKPQLSFL